MQDVLWAKKNIENGIFYWLPLRVHLEDCKGMLECLWEHWLCTGQKKLIADSLYFTDGRVITDREELAKRLACFLGAVHDIGKATPVFQSMRRYGEYTELEEYLLGRLESFGLTGMRTVTFSSPKPTRHGEAGQVLLKSYGVKDDISAIIGAHHGMPADVGYEDYDVVLENRKKEYFQSEKPEEKIYSKWDNIQSDIFKWALVSNGFESVDDLPGITQPAQVLLAGLLIMADWIASNEKYFPLFELYACDIEKALEDGLIKDKASDFDTHLMRLQNGFNIWKKTDNWSPHYIYEPSQLYDERFGFAPRSIQEKLHQLINTINNPGIIILEAPMGGGKTEAALAAAELLANRTGRSGIFFGLPTQATSDGIFPRLLDWIKSFERDLIEPVSLHLVHGKAQLNEEFLSLTYNIEEDGGDKRFIVNDWFSGKKTTSMDDFVVGTVDQFLMVALKQRHLMLRHLGFSKKVVIIDEVHAYDAYMDQYMEQAITWMGAYGVPVIMLSATLPAEKRIAFIKAYLSGRKTINQEDVEFSEIEAKLQTMAYPLVTYTDGNKAFIFDDFIVNERKDIDIIKINDCDLFDTVCGLSESNGIIGIIVNTVKRAQNLAHIFVDKFGDDKVEVLHSGFIATERVKKEKDLIRSIGKDATRPDFKIIIGTQVIEQSLDIDFDVMISDLAPMDLLLQRMGRLHRHPIKRPEKHKKPTFYVVGTSANFKFDEGSAYVYGNYILAMTQKYLKDCISIPNDISPLVQQVYAFIADETINEKNDSLSPDIMGFQEKYKARKKQKEARAKNYRLANPEMLRTNKKNSKTSRNPKTPNLMSWLKNSLIDDSEERGNAQVRDSEDSIEVIAIKKMGNGYGLFGEKEAISERIYEFDVAKAVARNTIKLPAYLTKEYNIDNTIEFLEAYNMKHLPEWRNILWLRSSLGIIFDENNECLVPTGNKMVLLHYDEKYGISMSIAEKGSD